jgi:hypothetical protein
MPSLQPGARLRINYDWSDGYLTRPLDENVACVDCNNPILKDVWVAAPATTDQLGANNSYSQLYTDVAGDVFVTGTFTGTFYQNQLPIINHTPIFSSAGEWDCFVAKYKSDGTLEPNFAFNIGGINREIGAVIAPHPTNGFFVGGISFSPTLTVPSPGNSNATAVVLTNPSIQSIFLARYNASRELIWALNLPGANNTQINDMAVDPAGNVYITGRADGSINFNPLDGNNPANFSSLDHAYIAKYDPNGYLIWVRLFEAPIGLDLALDPTGTGAVYVCGEMSGTPTVIGFTATSGIYPSHLLGISTSGPSPFIIKFDADGIPQERFVIQSPGGAYGIEANGNGLYVVGKVSIGTVDFAPLGIANSNTLMQGYPVLANQTNFLAKYTFNLEGQELLLLDQASGAFEVASGPSGKIYVAGYAGSRYMQAYVLDQDLNPLQELKLDVHINPDDEIQAIATDPFGNFIVSGRAKSTPFDADPEAADGAEMGFSDGLSHVFIAKYTCDCPPACCISEPDLSKRQIWDFLS